MSWPKATWRWKGFIWLILLCHSLLRKAKAGTTARSTDEFCLLARSSWLPQFPSLYNQDLLPRGGTPQCAGCSHSSHESRRHLRLTCRSTWQSLVPNWRSLFPDNPSLCPEDKTNQHVHWALVSLGNTVKDLTKQEAYEEHVPAFCSPGTTCAMLT